MQEENLSDMHDDFPPFSLTNHLRGQAEELLRGFIENPLPDLREWWEAEAPPAQPSPMEDMMQAGRETVGGVLDYMPVSSLVDRFERRRYTV